MKTLIAVLALTLVSVGSAGCSRGQWPDTTVGFNQPASSQQAATLGWAPVPGASAYNVVLSLDRAGTQPIGVTGFTATPAFSTASIAWHEGFPIAGRPIFWIWRAYDRPDPTGLLLATGEPREFTPGASGDALPSIGLQASGTLAPQAP